MSRQLIVVDFETTGLGPDAAIVEAAAVNVDTGEELYFVPFLDDKAVSVDALFALKLNGYIERELWNAQLTPNDTRESFMGLSRMLKGNTFAGSNPAFDSRLFARDYPGLKSWHHRLGDLAAYAAGKWDIDPTNLPGVDKVIELLGIEISPEERHSALGDARITGEAFRRLREIRRG
jgi:DNA polymerase-3 subunit epsilon